MSNNTKSHAASTVAQSKKGRVQDLGRGSCSKNILQSPLSGLPSGANVKVQVPTESAHKDETTPGSLEGVPALQEPSCVAGQVSHATVSGSVGPGKQGLVPGAPLSSGSVTPDLGSESTATTSSKRRRRRKFAKLSLVSATTQEDKGAGSKRPRSEGTTPSPNLPAVSKKPKRDPPGSFAAAVQQIKVAIIKEDFPKSRLSTDEWHTIQLALLERYDSVPREEQLPRITSNFLQKGALVLQCGDSRTEEWIKSCFDGNREVLGDAILKVIPASELPKPIKVAFKTKDVVTKDHGIFLRRLERSNPDLNTAEWRVLQVITEEHNARWILEVEAEDAEAIRKADFSAYTGLDRGTFKILHDPNTKRDNAGKTEEDCASDAGASSASSQVSSETLMNLKISTMNLDSGSENTLEQPDSPLSLSEMDTTLLDRQEGDPSDSPSSEGPLG